MLMKNEILKKQMSNRKLKKVNIFQFTPSSTTDLTMQHTHTGATHALQTTNKLSTSVRRFPPLPDSPLENPQSDTHRNKDPNPKQQIPATNSRTHFQKTRPIESRLSPVMPSLQPPHDYLR
jgi:hypothetical protein